MKAIECRVQGCKQSPEWFGTWNVGSVENGYGDLVYYCPKHIGGKRRYLMDIGSYVPWADPIAEFWEEFNS